MTDSQDVGALFLARARYYLLTEYRTKLRCAVEVLSEDKVWWRPHASSNSVGNLVLHLMGNVRQWIVSGLGGVPDSRNRAAEFSASEGMSAQDLMLELERVLVEADEVLSTIAPETLLERRVIQGRDVTVFEAIFGVVQHFSQHLGQVIWIAKHSAPGAINFVEDADGLARQLWPAMIRPPHA